MIPRLLEDKLVDRLINSGKVLVLYGARQVGKTTLAKKVLEKAGGKILEINADRQIYVDVLSSRDFDKLKGLVSGYDILFIDEAQRIPDIGINLKILHDELPELKIIVTGSSSFDLANRVKEPLTGRTWTYKLYPISASEWQNHASINDFEMQMNLDQWMRYGLYPQVLSFDNYEDKRQYLEEITGAYLYKDILALANIYFWRTHSGAELDYVEEKDGRLFGFEFKWKSKGGKAPKTWMETYDNASYKLVNQDNFMEFVSGN